MYMGANKLETVKVLLDAGASLDFRAFTGGNVLMAAAENEDSDPDIVSFLKYADISFENGDYNSAARNYGLSLIHISEPTRPY